MNFRPSPKEIQARENEFLHELIQKSTWADIKDALDTAKPELCRRMMRAIKSDDATEAGVVQRIIVAMYYADNARIGAANWAHKEEQYRREEAMSRERRESSMPAAVLMQQY